MDINAIGAPPTRRGTTIRMPVAHRVEVAAALALLLVGGPDGPAQHRRER